MREYQDVTEKVKKKLNGILASWNTQYKNEASMRTAANLYQPRRSNTRWSEAQASKDEQLEAVKRKNKEEARRNEKEEAERLRKEEKRKRENAGKLKPRRKPFNFEEVPLHFLSFGKAIDSAVFPGETQDTHPDRERNPIREQPRQCHHCERLSHTSFLPRP
jgi:hypothetical protein